MAMAWQASPAWRVVIAGNRDELHTRPSAALARWDDAPHVLAGRDLVGGGTWLGVSDHGRFAVVTNFAGTAANTAAPSRGALAADVLVGARAADPGGDDLVDYNGVNFLTVSPKGAWFATNRPRPAQRRLTPGIHGLSNGAFDRPWQRTAQLGARVRAWVDRPAADIGDLLDALATGNAPAATPRDRPAESQPVFIRDPVYGTRCSTVVTVDAMGDGRIVERRFDATGAVIGETWLTFDWPG